LEFLSIFSTSSPPIEDFLATVLMVTLMKYKLDSDLCVRTGNTTKCVRSNVRNNDLLQCWLLILHNITVLRRNVFVHQLTM